MLQQFVKTFSMGLFFVVVMVMFFFIILFNYGKNLPSHEFLKHYQSPTSTRVYSKDLTLIKEFRKQNRIAISVSKIPEQIKQAFLVAEDKDFYYHAGIDFRRLIHALFQNISHYRWTEKAVGASTITQQVAKNLLVGNEKSFSRKIREAIMAFRLEMTLSKNRILEIYLNEIYLGSGFYGVAVASMGYFGKPLNNLSIAEIAYLASLPKSPSCYHPIRNKERAISRRNWVIYRMFQEKLISKQQAKEAFNEDLVVQKNTSHTFESFGEYYVEEIRRLLLHEYGEQFLYEGGLSVITSMDLNLQKFADQALEDGIMEYEKRHGWRGAIKNINLDQFNERELRNELSKIFRFSKKRWQVAVVKKVEKDCAYIMTSKGVEGKIFLKDTLWAKPWSFHCQNVKQVKTMCSVLTQGDIIYVKKHESTKENSAYNLCQNPQVTGGIIVLDPHTGEVLALSGGFDFTSNQFNCVTQAYRQPGSSFKPFVYLTALEKGFTEETIIEDKPLNIDLGFGLGIYSPRNYSRTSYGAKPLRNGIIYSYNLMTVNLAQQIGMESIQKVVEVLHVMEKMPLQLAMSLGAGETTLLKISNAYASIINHGRKINPIFIKTIHNHQGQIIDGTSSPFLLPTLQTATQVSWNQPEFYRNSFVCDNRVQVISQKSADIIRKLFIEAVRVGNARKLNDLMGKYNIKIGGKTGTTNSYKDAWFIGFIELPNKKSYVIGTFLGFPFPKTLGDKETGGRAAIPIFRNFINYAVPYLLQTSKVKEHIKS